MDSIAVLDFGGQYAHLIANRIRRLGVYSEIKEAETSAQALKGFKGIILSGGPSSVNDNGSPQCDPKLFELGIPILGICYGHQLMVKTLGGDVKSGKYKEYGYASLNVIEKSGLFKDGIESEEQVWMSHGDTVVNLPEGFQTIGSTEDCKQAAIANFDKNFYGIQFHAEVTHTPHGMNLLSNFVDICEAKREWSIQNFLDEEIQKIQKFVGDKKVFMLVSGGVDSTVAFAILEKALGTDNVYGLFVDTGFMRKDERKQIESSLQAAGFKNLHTDDASDRFFDALKEVYEPEHKRELIGKLFVDVQADVTSQMNLDPEKWILGQGTIYPDTIESGGTKHADKIKTHHNRVEQIQKLIDEGKVIEPLKDLYKDEVRKLGELLGLAPELVWRHPFPGPGLAVRCLCNQNDTESLYPADHESDEAKINDIVSQYNLQSRILPIKSVGVQGDARTYRHPAVLFGADVDWSVLAELSTQITNQFSSVNRVLYCNTEKIDNPQSRNVYLTRDRIQVLQEADRLVHDIIAEANVHQDIWQFPVVLLPIQVNSRGDESIVLRPVCSQEAMTANFYEMDKSLLAKMRLGLLNIIGISEVFYDITNKPPGTIEWE